MPIHIVDDELIITEVMSEVLEERSKVILCFRSAEEYLLYADSDGYVAPKLIISDVIMGGMDGFELIKTLQFKGLKAKVMIMSGFNKCSERSCHGIDYMLSKPFHPDKLLVAVSQLLD